MTSSVTVDQHINWYREGLAILITSGHWWRDPAQKVSSHGSSLSSVKFYYLEDSGIKNKSMNTSSYEKAQTQTVFSINFRPEGRKGRGSPLTSLDK